MAAALMADNLGDDLLSGVPFTFSRSDIVFEVLMMRFNQKIRNRRSLKIRELFQNLLLMCFKVFVYLFLGTTRLSIDCGIATNLGKVVHRSKYNDGVIEILKVCFCDVIGFGFNDRERIQPWTPQSFC